MATNVTSFKHIKKIDEYILFVTNNLAGWKKKVCGQFVAPWWWLPVSGAEDEAAVQAKPREEGP